MCAGHGVEVHAGSIEVHADSIEVHANSIKVRMGSIEVHAGSIEVRSDSMHYLAVSNRRLEKRLHIGSELRARQGSFAFDVPRVQRLRCADLTMCLKKLICQSYLCWWCAQV